MKVLATQRQILPVLIFSGMNLVLTLPIGAAADELPRESGAAPLFDANRVSVDNLDFQDDSDYASTDRAIIIFMWPPVTRIDVGGELLWGRRENKDGTSATARQIQFGAKYRF